MMDYTKVSLLENESSNRRRRNQTKPSLTALISLALLMIIISGSTIAAVIAYKRSLDAKSLFSTPSKAVQSVCKVTPHRRSCFISISAINTASETNPGRIFALSLRVAIDQLTNTTSLIPQTKDPRFEQGLIDCRNLLKESISLLEKSLMSVCCVHQGESIALTDGETMNLWKWTNDAMLDYRMCLGILDKLRETGKELPFFIELRKKARICRTQMRNSLAIFNNLRTLIDRFQHAFYEDWVPESFIICVQYTVLIFLFCLLLHIY